MIPSAASMMKQSCNAHSSEAVFKMNTTSCYCISLEKNMISFMPCKSYWCIAYICVQTISLLYLVSFEGELINSSHHVGNPRWLQWNAAEWHFQKWQFLFIFIFRYCWAFGLLCRIWLGLDIDIWYFSGMSLIVFIPSSIKKAQCHSLHHFDTLLASCLYCWTLTSIILSWN